MGIFGKLFGNNTEKLFSNTMNEYFNLWSISKPTDEIKLRMIFALFLGSAACLNELSSGNAVRSKIDSLSEVASNLSSPLRISVNDLFPKEISRIDKEQFLKELPVPVSNTNIRLNGLAAFPALHSQGPQIIKEIMNSNDGPFGITGYASLVIGEIVIGRERSKKDFTTSMVILPKFLKSIS